MNTHHISPAFREHFEYAQAAFARGDLDAIASRLCERSAERARKRAEVLAGLRDETTE